MPDPFYQLDRAKYHGLDLRKAHKGVPNEVYEWFQVEVEYY
jgi:hypothetical protein